MKSFIPWVGGKSKLLWLIHKLSPSRYSRFIDVFGGSGTVTLSRPIQQGCMEVYNDFNGDLTNLFCCVKNRTMALLLELGFLPLNTRDDFNVLYKFFSREEFTDDYLSSLSEAKRQNEVALWRASHLENIACKQAIEEAIRKGFDGMHLSHDCARGVIEDFGFKRVGWVLAATIQLKPEDGRFSRRNKEWAAATFIPRSDRNYEFMVESHAGVLDIFVNEFREAQDALGMFTRSHCDDMTGQELEGKVLVMSPFTLKESYWAPENQLWLATGGFGCAPNAAGRAVYATCLGDGEQTRWNRSDFIGILREEHLPDWARESLKQIRQEDPAESPDMTTPTM